MHSSALDFSVEINDSTISDLSKTFAKRSVGKALEHYQQLENKALDALKARFPKTLAAYENQNELQRLRQLNQDISKRIDATLAVYLPKIEAQLRQTLEAEAKQHIQQLRKQAQSD
jgi:methionyl-tRNA synthetase